MITPDHIRAYANLPTEVPTALLQRHIDRALRDLPGMVGQGAAPAGMDAEWADALTIRALITVLPWLHTFALSGVSKVGRLEGAVEFRFLNPDEVAAMVKILEAEFSRLVGVIAPAGDDGPGVDAAQAGNITMMAV